MKAVILSAGKGKRLGPLTKKIPKPMIKISGKPVLEHNVLLCKSFGVEDIFLNLHHLPDYIKGHFNEGSEWGVKITYKYEKKLLGTAGTVNNFKEFLDKPFLVIYGDNFFGDNVDLNSLESFHNLHKSDFTIVLSQLDDVSLSGVAELTKSNKITRFIEKPTTGESNDSWINAGIYLINPEVLEVIKPEHTDFGKDVIPFLIGNNYDVYGFKMKNRVIPIDTPKLLKKIDKVSKT